MSVRQRGAGVIAPAMRAALALAFCLASDAAAVSIPDATFMETLAPNVEGGVADPDPSVPNSLWTSLLAMNANGSAQLSGSAVSVGGTQPTLSASATADGGASFRMDASVDVRYYFAVSGPASATPIPILITYSGVGAATGLVADGLGRIQVDRLLPGVNLIYETFGFSSAFPPTTNTFGDTVLVNADVDHVYSVRLEAVARAQAYGGISQADVTVDPLIQVDPSFVNADLYDIAYSENIGTPEPNGSLPGLAGLATVALRRALLGTAS